MEQVNLEKRLQRRRLRDGVLEYTILTVATVIMVVGVYVFKFPNNFSFGGVTGIAIVLAALVPLSASTINFIINVALMLVGFLFLGKSFGIKTVYVSLLMSAGLSFLEYAFPMSHPLTDQPMLELLFAIAMILKKYTRLDDIGTPLFLVDFVITVMACLVFDVKTGLFSFTGLLAKSLVIDSVIENINLCKYFTIICNHPQPICDYIHDELGRSATVFKGEGTYEHKERYIILTVLKRGQSVELRNFIKTHDPEAFLMITNSSEIIGKGFRGLN